MRLDNDYARTLVLQTRFRGGALDLCPEAQTSGDLRPDRPAADSDAFLANTQPGAWERVVNRPHFSPQYDEKWGRHWLDIACYADTNS